LSEFYLHHRLSEDIDLFSEQEVNTRVVEAFLKKISTKLKIAKIVKQNFLGLFTYILHYEDGSMLKIDFNNYPFPQIEKGKTFGKLEISSVYDIAVNKIHTISMKPRTRDYIDLYFIIQKMGWDMDSLLKKARIKFDWHIDLLQWGSQLLQAEQVRDYPKMIKEVNPKDWQEFFVKEARKIKKDIIE